MDQGDSYVKVHPDFRAIFTSNPAEYAGIHKTQDALSDRFVSMDLDYYDRETEIAITAVRSGLPADQAAKIVDLVRDYRAMGEYDQTPTLRACIMIARVTALQGLKPSLQEEAFVRVCLDVLESKVILTSQARERRAQQHEMLCSLIAKHCGARARAKAA